MITETSITGKVAIVTGASSGIGRAIAHNFASQGCRLAITGRNYENLEETKAQCVQLGLAADSILLVKADMMYNDDVKRIMDESMKYFNELDILVNNAGIVCAGQIDQFAMDKYNEVMQINVHSVVYLTKLAIPHLEKNKGCIVNVSSVNGLRPFANVWAYCMSKSAIDQFTRCLSVDLAPRGIRINNVNPGVITTPIHERSGRTPEEIVQFREHSRSTHALQRVGEATEVAGVVSFLVSDRAAQTTGASLLIDGGRAMMAFPQPVDS